MGQCNWIRARSVKVKVYALSEKYCGAAGTDGFQRWTTAEKAANLDAIGQVFTHLGIDFRPRVMTLAEAFC